MKNTNDIKIYDVDKVFELNPDMKISMQYIGKEKLPLIIIDDFYKNPELVRDLLISSPVPKNTSEFQGGYPGLRVTLDTFITSKKFQQNYSDILKFYFGFDFDLIVDRESFIGNVFDGSGPASKYNNQTPHVDPAAVASIVYLNTDDEEVGGTSIYRHRESNLPFFPSSDFHFNWWCEHLSRVEGKNIDEIKQREAERFEKFGGSIFKPSKTQKNMHILESNEEWEILSTVDAKFNRLAGYIGGTLHSAMIDFDELAKKPYKRINQVLFMVQKEV